MIDWYMIFSSTQINIDGLCKNSTNYKGSLLKNYDHCDIVNQIKKEKKHDIFL
jgi:hypothetical protein